MSKFIMPQVEEGEWWRIIGSTGVLIIPFVVSPTPPPLPYEGEVEGMARVNGFGARMTDTDFCEGTPWVVFNTNDEARKHLAETYNRCPVCLNELWNGSQCSGDHD